MSEIELKPCPFCGGKARLDEMVCEAAVQCNNVDCRAMVKAEHGSYDYSGTTKATRAWNTRPTPEGAVEKMREDISILLATIDNHVEAVGEPLSPCDAAMVEQIRVALSLSGNAPVPSGDDVSAEETGR